MDDLFSYHVPTVSAKSIVSRSWVLRPLKHRLVPVRGWHFILHLDSIVTEGVPLGIGSYMGVHGQQILHFRLRIVPFKAKDWLLEDVVDYLLDAQSVVSLTQAVPGGRIWVVPAHFSPTDDLKSTPA